MAIKGLMVAGQVASSKGFWLVDYDNEAFTLTLNTSYAGKTPLSSQGDAVCAGPSGTSFVASEDVVTCLNTDWTVNTDWATSGVYTVSGRTITYLVYDSVNEQVLICSNHATGITVVDAVTGVKAFDYTSCDYLSKPGRVPWLNAAGTEAVISTTPGGGSYHGLYRFDMSDGTQTATLKYAINQMHLRPTINAAEDTLWSTILNAGTYNLYEFTHPAYGYVSTVQTSGGNVIESVLSADETMLFTVATTDVGAYDNLTKIRVSDNAVMATYDCGQNTNIIKKLNDGSLLVTSTTAGADEDGDTQNIRIFNENLVKLAGVYTGDLGGTTQLIDIAESTYVPPTNVTPGEGIYSKKLVAACRNRIWYGTTPADMAELTAAADEIDLTKLFGMAEAYGKVFVANGTVRKVADFTNDKLTTSDIAGGVGIPLHDDVVTGGSSGAQMIIDLITSSTSTCTVYGKRITTAEFTNGETVTGTNADGDAVSFVIATPVANPHWYDWIPYANDAATYGSLPTNTAKVFVSQGRVGLTLDNLYPHQWYLSRQSNPWDWVYGADDTQSAVAGNNTDAGEVGDVIVDAFPYKDVYTVFGNASSFWYMTGNPCQGGLIQELDITAGLLGIGAWCWDDADNLYAVTTKGLVKYLSGFTGQENLTHMKYPDFVKDIAFDRATQRMTLSYDRDNNGIIISVTTLDGGVNTNWWYDLTSQGLFPESYPTTASIYCSEYFNADAAADRTLVFGGQDGNLREFLPTAKSDDDGAADVAIDSYVTFAPIPLSQSPREDGSLSQIDIITGGDNDGGTNDSDALTMTVFGERTAEKVIKSAVNNTGAKLTKVISGAGVQRGSVEKRRVRGRYGAIKLRNTTLAQSWALENINFIIKKAGKVR